MKPVIGLTSHIDKAQNSPLGKSSIGNTYVESIMNSGGIPIILPVFIPESEMEAYINLCDGFLFSGGIDISPNYYDEDAHEKLGETLAELDRTQIPFMQKVLAAKKPVLGICRGCQVLNVACGGTLYQDLSEHSGTYIKHFQKTGPSDISHQVILENESILSQMYAKTFWVNSYHHQAVKEPGSGVRIIAYSKDGIPEAIQLKDFSYGLGIQWHPEAMFAHGDSSMKPLFESLVQACMKFCEND